MSKNNLKLVIGILILFVLMLVAFAVVGAERNSGTKELYSHNDAQNSIVTTDSDEYELEQMLIVSRHNIRSPLSGGDSLLGQVTPHQWFEWTSEASELSVKGGQLETSMGQFFRKYLEAKDFIPENWQPKDGEVRFYANSMQRTIATSRFFASGMLPVADVDIEYHEKYNDVDPIFCPIIRYNNPKFEKQVRAEIDEACGEYGLAGVGRDLQESYELLEEVLDFRDSAYAEENNLTHIPLNDTEIEMTVGEEVKLTGGLALANSAVDALKLQIYEEEDLNKALFGHEMTAEDIQKICRIGDMYQKICEGTPTLASQVMGPMMEEMQKELNTQGRKFTFLCGHDSTLTALVCALGIEEYELPEAISCKAPIGAKMVFEKYRGVDGKDYVKVSMCYNTTDQLRKTDVTSLDEPPMFHELEFKGLKKNKDGYYNYDDVMDRFDDAEDKSDLAA